MDKNYIYKYSLKKANFFNMYCLFIMAILAVIALIFIELRIFPTDLDNARFCMGEVIIFGIAPFMIYLIHDKILKRENSVLEMPFLKWIILVIAYENICSMIILFSFHATLLLVIPTLISVQYKNDKFLSIITIVISLMLVILTTYGSLLFGEYDANLLKPLTKAESESFQARLDLFLSVRSFEILYHHILPKLLCVLMIDVISLMISRRYDDMISLQIKLSDEVQKENVSKVNMQNAVIEHLADIIESRDIETGEHIKRTKIYVSILVNKMKDMDKYKDILTPKLQEDIINSAPLHDIGKIAVSDLILCKPGKLTDEEYDKMKIHTVKGGEIIKKILAEFDDKSFLNTAYDVAISHHEKWNGLGYPYGIKGEEIPLAGRIMAVADVFDALVAKRVYKQPMPIDKAVSIIIGDAGTHFDPDIIEVFKEVVDDFKKVALDE